MTDNRPPAAAQDSAAKNATEAPKAAPAPSSSSNLGARSSELPAKDKYRVRVERVLEQNLWELYLALPQASREAFKAKGEAAAAALRSAMESKSVRPAQVLAPVHRWLKTIPHVNPYFLEQEAKIKTDLVMALVDERRKEEGLE